MTDAQIVTSRFSFMGSVVSDIKMTTGGVAVSSKRCATYPFNSSHLERLARKAFFFSFLAREHVTRRGFYWRARFCCCGLNEVRR